MTTTTPGTIVVTGASTGIGAACALMLDHMGFRVFAGVRTEAASAELQRQASHRLTPIFLDVTDAATIATAAGRVAQETGAAGVSGLVNNAGIAIAGPLEFMPVDELRKQLEVNVIGQVAVTQAFLPQLRQGQGRIVFIGSIAGKSAVPLMGPYSASKFALEAVADTLRLELRPWGMHVAIIEPGTIATPIWQKSLAMADALTAQLPPRALHLYGRLIQFVRERAASVRGIPPEQVARAVVHALTARLPRTRYVVGRDAQLRLVLERLPTRLRDRVVMRSMRS